MTENEIRRIIQQTANETEIALKKAGLMKNNKQTAYKKTEQLLRSCSRLRSAVDLNKDDAVKTARIVEIIDAALEDLREDEYCGRIELIYFEGMTREECAEIYGVEPITVTRNKNRLVNKLTDVLFSDDVIIELFDL